MTLEMLDGRTYIVVHSIGMGALPRLPQLRFRQLLKSTGMNLIARALRKATGRTAPFLWTALSLASPLEARSALPGGVCGRGKLDTVRLQSRRIGLKSS